MSTSWKRQEIGWKQKTLLCLAALGDFNPMICWSRPITWSSWLSTVSKHSCILYQCAVSLIIKLSKTKLTSYWWNPDPIDCCQATKGVLRQVLKGMVSFFCLARPELANCWNTGLLHGGWFNIGKEGYFTNSMAQSCRRTQQSHRSKQRSCLRAMSSVFEQLAWCWASISCSCSTQENTAASSSTGGSGVWVWETEVVTTYGIQLTKGYSQGWKVSTWCLLSTKNSSTKECINCWEGTIITKWPRLTSATKCLCSTHSGTMSLGSLHCIWPACVRDTSHASHLVWMRLILSLWATPPGNLCRGTSSMWRLTLYFSCSHGEPVLEKK